MSLLRAGRPAAPFRRFSVAVVLLALHGAALAATAPQAPDEIRYRGYWRIEIVPSVDGVPWRVALPAPLVGGELHPFVERLRATGNRAEVTVSEAGGALAVWVIGVGRVSLVGGFPLASTGAIPGHDEINWTHETGAVRADGMGVFTREVFADAAAPMRVAVSSAMNPRCGGGTGVDSLSATLQAHPRWQEVKGSLWPPGNAVP